MKYDSNLHQNPRTAAKWLLVRRLLILCSFTLSLFLLLAATLTAQDTEEVTDKTPEQGSEDNISALLQKGPLVVPVYPRGTLEKEAPSAADLGDSYIILQDGSALSVADWILGSLKKDESGLAMTDYENRLFLGQVARAAAGMDESLVNHSLVNIAPTVNFKAPPPPGAVMQTLQAFTGFIAGAILPGTPEGWHPGKTGGAFNPTMKSGGDAAILFETQFERAMMQTASDFKEEGTMRIMMEEARKTMSGRY